MMIGMDISTTDESFRRIHLISTGEEICVALQTLISYVMLNRYSKAQNVAITVSVKTIFLLIHNLQCWMLPRKNEHMIFQKLFKNRKTLRSNCKKNCTRNGEEKQVYRKRLRR